MLQRMKTEPSKVKRSAAVRKRQLKPKAKHVPTLPDWVIGVYDGPKDKHLSTKEGYSR